LFRNKAVIDITKQKLEAKMAQLFVKHKVKDYNAWKKVFDGFVETRKASGEKNYQIFHPDNDPNNLLAIFDWDNLENAKKFAGSQELKGAMQNAGVIEKPEIYFLEEYTSGNV
jgi:quinol monooxygenase YgiN